MLSQTHPTHLVMSRSKCIECADLFLCPIISATRRGGHKGADPNPTPPISSVPDGSDETNVKKCNEKHQKLGFLTSENRRFIKKTPRLKATATQHLGNATSPWRSDGAPFRHRDSPKHPLRLTISHHLKTLFITASRHHSPFSQSRRCVTSSLYSYS